MLPCLVCSNDFFCDFHVQDVRIDKQLKPGVRVTVRLSDNTKSKFVCLFFCSVNLFLNISSSLSLSFKYMQTDSSKHHRGVVVSPTAPRQEAGLYWGYSVRLANSFGAVFTESPHKVCPKR